MTQVNSTNELALKIDRLPNGIIAKVSERLGVSKSLVTKVKNGHRNNIKIFEAILQELEKYNKERDQRVAELQQRANKINS